MGSRLETEQRDVPLFPLQTVLFPGGLLPLRVFEQRYLEMAKGCLRDNTPFGVCLIRDGAEVGAPATPEDIGCLAHIKHWDMQQLGLLQLVAQGGRRFRIVARRIRADGLILADIALLVEQADAPLPEKFGACRRLLERIVADHGERLFAAPFLLDSSAWVGARLAEVLPLPAAARQKLLELDSALERLEILDRLLADSALAPNRSGQS
ncbi:MAG TPA: LON peptidase substrate-binding domain-containing protein [Burkholderiales bacterium]|nr:LON peptidase substrate-binding domain-containing protein [Burkholderiales bacterium]